MAVPWRERPRDLAGSAITPAATEEVAHATLSLSQPEQTISSMRPAQSAKARAICTVVLHAAVAQRLCGSQLARSRRSALLLPLRPRCARLTALTARSANLLEGNYRRPHVNLLTTRADGAIVEFSSTAAARNPLHIARCGARRIGGLRSRFVSLSIHFLVADSRDDTSAKPTIGTDCASASGQSADPSDPTIDIVTLPRHVACQSSMHREPHSVLPIHCRTSTRTGIDVQTWAGVSWPNRRRHRRERRRQHRPLVRTNANNQIDAQCDESLARFRPSAGPSGCARAVRGGTDAPLRRDSLRHASTEGRHLRALLVGQPA